MKREAPCRPVCKSHTTYLSRCEELNAIKTISVTNVNLPIGRLQHRNAPGRILIVGSDTETSQKSSSEENGRSSDDQILGAPSQPIQPQLEIF